MGEIPTYHPPEASFKKPRSGKREIAAALVAASLAGGIARADTRPPAATTPESNLTLRGRADEAIADVDKTSQDLKNRESEEKTERKKGIEDRIKNLSTLDPQKYTAEKVEKLLKAFEASYAQDTNNAVNSFDANLKKIEEKYPSQQSAKSPTGVGEKAAAAHQEMESGLEGFAAFFDANTDFHHAIDALRKIINPGEATEYNGIRFNCLKDGTITSKYGKLTPEVRKKLMDEKARMDETRDKLMRGEIQP